MEQKTSDRSLPQSMVLMYHRIDNTVTDPWGICVPPDQFEDQVRFLKNNFNIISVGTLVDQLRAGELTDNSICLTFDDGYEDNWLYAKPVLEKYHCPATFFIPTAFIGQRLPFWWDELELIFLHADRLPANFSILINGVVSAYNLDARPLTKAQKMLHAGWRWYAAPPTSRCAVFFQAWEKLRPLPMAAIEEQMRLIRIWAGKENIIAAERLPMSAQQLTALSENPLFTIGMHTHTHPDLSGKPELAQVHEMDDCKELLRRQYGMESPYLAYPYGSYDSATLKAASQVKAAACFTTRPGCITVASNPLAIGRFQVLNWNAAGLAEQIYAWRDYLPATNNTGNA